MLPPHCKTQKNKIPAGIRDNTMPGGYTSVPYGTQNRSVFPYCNLPKYRDKFHDFCIWGLGAAEKASVFPKKQSSFRPVLAKITVLFYSDGFHLQQNTLGKLCNLHAGAGRAVGEGFAVDLIERREIVHVR